MTSRKPAASAAVAERPSAVPALVQPRLELDSSDVALPRIYIGQHMSNAVQEGLVKPGSIFAAIGADDADPSVLWEPADNPKPGVLFHVIGLRKGKSITVDGDLQTFDFHDPSAPAEAWTTYSYFVVLPDHDQDMPFKLLLTRTGAPAAKQINLVLKKNEARGPSWESAFRLTTAKRENDKGKYFVARVSVAEASASNVGVAEALAGIVQSQGTPEIAAHSDEPAI